MVYEKATTSTPPAHKRNFIKKLYNIQTMIPDDQKKYLLNTMLLLCREKNVC